MLPPSSSPARAAKPDSKSGELTFGVLMSWDLTNVRSHSAQSSPPCVVFPLPCISNEKDEQ